MPVQLICVPPERVIELWPHVQHYIDAAMEHAHLRTAQDVQFALFTHRNAALLWLGVENDRIVAALVTELHDGACWIIAFGADDFAACVPLLPEIEQFARNEGCHAVRLMGRKGWTKMLHDYGYGLESVLLEKELH